jgi:hypothetical protein
VAGRTPSMPCTLSAAEMASRLAPSFRWHAAWFSNADFLQVAKVRSCRTPALPYHLVAHPITND